MDAMDSDQLYGLPLDQFVAERGALVNALRADGDRGQAAEVAALRKPSVAAWAVNQLVRTQRRAVDDLFAAGDTLRDVQAEVMAGRQDAQALRDAARDERAAGWCPPAGAGSARPSSTVSPTRSTPPRSTTTRGGRSTRAAWNASCVMS